MESKKAKALAFTLLMAIAITSGDCRADESPSPLTALRDKGNAAMLSKDYKTAETSFQQEMALAEKSKGAQSSEYALSLCDLITCAVIQGQVAEDLNKKLIALIKANKIDDTAKLAANEVGQAYKEFSGKGKGHKSSNYMQALLLREAILGANNPQLENNFSILSRAYLDEGKYKEALPYLKKGKESAEKLYGKENAEFLKYSFRMAVTYDHLGQYAEAQKYYQEANALAQKLHSKVILKLSARGLDGIRAKTGHKGAGKPSGRGG